MAVFEALTVAIAALSLWSVLYAVRQAKDTLHPLAYLMPMVFFSYVLGPMELIGLGLLQHAGVPDSDLALAQAINLFMVVALVAGTLRGGRVKGQAPIVAPGLTLSKRQKQQAFLLSGILGAIAVVGFWIGLSNVGGFFAAYGGVKGGGTADSGYVRDAVMLAVPATALLAVVTEGGLELRYWTFSAITVGPVVLHGLLSGRRGPTFLGIATIVFSWYLSRGRKPAVTTLLAGGIGVGIFLIFLVTFRSEFSLGSELANRPRETAESMLAEFAEERAAGLDRNLGGVEFVFGVNVIRSYMAEGNYFWGRRVATVLFIRPIPKELWPSKYEDVGMDAYLTNVGLTLKQDFGLDATLGAAPGFAADLFAEFSWGGLIVAYLLGWGYGRAWANARRERGFWTVVYTVLGALSLYFVAQTLEAVLYRLTFMVVPAFVAWKLAGLPLGAHRLGQRPVGSRWSRA
jgi:hypothetical protein